MKAPLPATTLLLLSLLAGAGCSGSQDFEGECKRDSDCQSYQRCDTRDYRCICASDEACAPGEFCNASGSCQTKTSCLSNDDCTGQGVCDVFSGECIGPSACSDDVQCDIGQICEQGVCRLGCRETSDCDLMQKEICLDGQCRQGMCDGNPYCPFGQVCDLDSHLCTQPVEPHCLTGCSPTCELCGEDTSVGPCQNPANVCVRQDGETYCWVYCEGDEQCPAGYQCVPTTVSWSPLCESDSDCSDAPDPNDRVINVCDGTSGGQVVGRCRLNKQPCFNDADCYPFETHCQEGQCVFASHCRPPGGCN
ncbi:MAG: hypothetical protein DRI34_02155 [Deltaproteobacteria bacterium]|nr:MAG: hypothetical protein DRI34_02155 [Deltaproteobacteria bacterium]